MNCGVVHNTTESLPLTSGASASVYNKLLMNVTKRKRKFEKIRGFLYCGF